MAKEKNVWESVLKYELSKSNGIEAICKAIKSDYASESTAWCWYEAGRTEKEIINLLRKIGYKIPKEIVGSDQVLGNE